MGLTGEQDALALKDLYSGYHDCYPLKTKTAADAHGAFLDFKGREQIKYFWSDSAPELIKAAKSVGISHGKSTPGRHQMTGRSSVTSVKLWKVPG